MRRIFALILAAVVTVAVVGGILALAGKLPFLSDPAHIGGPTEPTATVIDHIGKEKKVAIVDGGDPNSPIWAEAANADIRTPVVRPGAITPSWTALDELLGSNAAYTQCVDSSNVQGQRGGHQQRPLPGDPLHPGRQLNQGPVQR